MVHMSVVCSAVQRFQFLQPDPPASCSHRSLASAKEIDTDFYERLILTIFSYILFPALIVNHKQRREGKPRLEVRAIHRIGGLFLGICAALYFTRPDVLCLLDIHCNGGCDRGFHHLIPVIRYLGVACMMGLFAFDIFAALHRWILLDGFTSYSGLDKTRSFLTQMLAFTAGFLVNQWSFPDWREFAHPDGQLILKCGVCLITLPQLTWWLVKKVRERTTDRRPHKDGVQIKDDLEAKSVKD